MSRRPALAAAVIVVLGVSMSGCQSAVAGSPSATTTDVTSETSDGGQSSEPNRLSPPVENPKNLRGVDPCELLTSEQKAELSLTEPDRRDTSPWGEGTCNLAGPVVTVSFSPNTITGEGLDQAYRAKNSFDNFAESNIDGYPAVRVNFATQSCGLIVGLSDAQTLSVGFTRVSPDAPGRGDPCGFAESVVGEVIKNLPDA